MKTVLPFWNEQFAFIATNPTRKETVEKIHVECGERLKRILIANLDLNYLEATALVFKTIVFAGRLDDLATSMKTYPILPRLLRIAEQLLREERRAA